MFHTPDHYYMVMDLYTGGDMYARYKFRSEDETAKIVNKLINALRYCHDRNVAVRPACETAAVTLVGGRGGGGGVVAVVVVEAVWRNNRTWQ